MRSFLGLADYYQKFAKRFLTIAKPLTCLMGKGVVFKWNEEGGGGVQPVKETLYTAPILTFPEPKHPFTIYMDTMPILREIFSFAGDGGTVVLPSVSSGAVI